MCVRPRRLCCSVGEKQPKEGDPHGHRGATQQIGEGLQPRVVLSTEEHQRNGQRRGADGRRQRERQNFDKQLVHRGRDLSNAKIRFQSAFIRMTVQPSFFASSKSLG